MELFTLFQGSAEVQQQSLRGEIIDGKRLDILSFDGHVIEVAGNAGKLPRFVSIELGILNELLDEQQLGIVFGEELDAEALVALDVIGVANQAAGQQDAFADPGTWNEILWTESWDAGIRTTTCIPLLLTLTDVPENVSAPDISSTLSRWRTRVCFRLSDSMMHAACTQSYIREPLHASLDDVFPALNRPDGRPVLVSRGGRAMRRPMGTIVRARLDVQSQHLKVIASVRMDAGEVVEAQVPDREVSAILPRSILLGTTTKAPLSMLETVRPIVERMSEGRRVRLWLYKERWFLSFQPWRGVRFVDDEPPPVLARAVDAAEPAATPPA